MKLKNSYVMCYSFVLMIVLFSVLGSLQLVSYLFMLLLCFLMIFLSLCISVIYFPCIRTMIFLFPFFFIIGKLTPSMSMLIKNLFLFENQTK